MNDPNIINITTIKLNEIAISMINASNTYKNHFNSVQMLCLLDELLDTQFKNCLEITFSTFKYINSINQKNLNYLNINIEKLIEEKELYKLNKRSDCYRTFAFIIFEIIFLINDSVDNFKITSTFYPNFINIFHKLLVFEFRYLQTDISTEIIEEIYNNNFRK